MQKDIGSVMGLYPTPVTVCGTVLADGRVNFLSTGDVIGQCWREGRNFEPKGE